MPNPSGGRGVYILTWSGVKQLCRPTVHDTLLHQRVSRLPVMSPAGVRSAARQLAAEGLAGKDATLAASASAAQERKELVLVNFLMLVTLMEQVEPAGLKISADTEHTPEEIDPPRPTHRGSCRTGDRPDAHQQVGEDLEALAEPSCSYRSVCAPKSLRPSAAPG